MQSRIDIGARNRCPDRRALLADIRGTASREESVVTLPSVKVRQTERNASPADIKTQPVYSRSASRKSFSLSPRTRAVLASLFFHLGLLILLGSVTYVATREFTPPVVNSVFDEADPPREFETVMHADEVGNHSDRQKETSSAASAELQGDNPNTHREQPLENSFEPDFRLPEVVDVPSYAELSQHVDLSGEVSAMVGGVEGALDRLVAEIRHSLSQRKTLVIWLFDASGSLDKRRADIAERFESTYAQLGQLKQADDLPLRTVVATFGESYQLLTEKPVDDVTRLVDVVGRIKMDQSGRENVFTAVQKVSQKFHKYRTRLQHNVMLVIVTDERGDDEQLLDETIQFNRRYGIRCFCIGNASTFGRELGYVTWTYPDGSTREFPVQQGPETAQAERLRLGFWTGARGRRNYRDFALNSQISSGYGPYGLTRLCAETGGLYLITEDARGPKFDAAVMRSYRPDYFSRQEYERRLAQNKAKAVLVQAAALTRNDRDGEIRVPQTEFRADEDAILRRQMTEAQKPMAKLTYQLDQLLSLLEAGEQDREKLSEPRWRAGYDLAMGRLLAMKVRSLGYNSVLAEMKSDPKKFANDKSDQWALEPSDEIISGARVRKMADKAKKYLTRVIDEHPQTPWGLLAERELSQPLGWKWVEKRIGYAQRDRRTAQGQTPRPNEAEEQRRRDMQRDGPKGL